MKYTEVKFVLKNNDVVIQTTQNRLESNGGTVITEFDFQKEKDKIKSDLLNCGELNDSTKVETAVTKYRKRR